MKIHITLLAVILLGLVTNVLTNEALQPPTELYSIEGKVYPPDSIMSNGQVENWQLQTRIMGNGGEFRGFLRLLFKFNYFGFSHT